MTWLVAGVSALTRWTAGRAAVVAVKAAGDVAVVARATALRARAELVMTILNLTDFGLRVLIEDKSSLRSGALRALGFHPERVPSAGRAGRGLRRADVTQGQGVSVTQSDYRARWVLS